MQKVESIVVGTFQHEVPEPRAGTRLSVFTAALVRNILQVNLIALLSAESLPTAAGLGKGPNGQSCITGHPLGTCLRRAQPVTRSLPPLAAIRVPPFELM